MPTPSKKTWDSLPEDERQVVELKYKSPTIDALPEVDFLKVRKALLLKIHVTTGWTIPASEEYLNVLVDQFGKHLQEKYAALNLDEIEFAFRRYGTTTEDYGKALNLNLVDKVLLPYLNDRYRISETERMLHYYARRPEFSLQRDVDYRRLLEEDYQTFLGGRFRLVTFPTGYYDTLAEDGFFEPSWWKMRARDYHRRYPHEPKEALIATAKDRCVLQLLRTARRLGKANLYVKA